MANLNDLLSGNNFGFDTANAESLIQQLLQQFQEYINKELSKLLEMLEDILNIKKNKDSNSQDNNDVFTLAAQQKLADAGIQAATSELEPILQEILETSVDESKYNISSLEVTFEDVMKIICTSFLLYDSSIFYIAQVVARKIVMYSAFEETMLSALAQSLTDLKDFSDMKEAGGITPDSMTDQADYMAKVTSDANSYLNKVSDAILSGSQNPTSVTAFHDTLQKLLAMDQIDRYIVYNDPADVVKKLLTRISYVTEIHKKNIALVDQWSKILDEYVELNLAPKFARSILDQINANLERWQEFFQGAHDEAKFTNLKNYLVFLSASDTVVSTLFESPSPSGVVLTEGVLDWLDDNDGDATSPILTNDTQLIVGDIIATDAPSMNDDGTSIATHSVTGVGKNYIHVSPEVHKPIFIDQDVHYVKLDPSNMGATYFGKYKALLLRLILLDPTKSIELSPTGISTTQYSTIRKDVGAFLWAYIEAQTSSTPSGELASTYTAATTELDVLKAQMVLLQNIFLSFQVPQQTNIDMIDDLLRDRGLTQLEDYLTSGRIKEFFNANVLESSTDQSLTQKINSLIKSVQVVA